MADGQNIVEKFYNELKERGIEYDDFYDFDTIDEMVEKKLLTSERVSLIKAVNHDYLLTFDERMLVNVWGQGYRIAPQCVQYNAIKKRGRKAEKQIVWGLKETTCMETNLLTPIQDASRTNGLNWGKMTLAAMRRSQQITTVPVANTVITKNDVKDAIKEVISDLDGFFDGKFKFK